MKIVFKNGFEMNKNELDKKSLEELYDIHCDLIMSYTHCRDKGEIDKLESYIDARIIKEDTVLSEAV